MLPTQNDTGPIDNVRKRDKTRTMNLLNLLEKALEKGITLSIDAEITISATDHEPGYLAECPDCGWTKRYDTPEAARRGLNGHKTHCTADGAMQMLRELQNHHNGSHDDE